MRTALTQWEGRFDTVIMNPPFGTRVPGVDVAFLKAALALARPGGSVYSLHKSSTRAHLLKCAAAWGVAGEALAQMRFPIPATYAFHRESRVDVEVDLLRLTRPGGGSGGGGGGGGGTSSGSGEVVVAVAGAGLAAAAGAVSGSSGRVRGRGRGRGSGGGGGSRGGR
jgi:hypothetical protein